MLKIQRFVFNIFHENTYLIWDDQTKEAVVIDPGMYDEKEESAFEKFIVLNSLILNYCINTHCHIDHVLGNSFVKSKYNAKLLSPKEDEFLLKMISEQAARFGLVAQIPPDPDQFISEEEGFSLGEFSGKFLFTPGHTPGEYCLVFEKEKILFSGDVLFKDSIGRTDLWNGNLETLLNSIKTKLFVLPDDVVVYPGHESTTTIGYEKKNNLFLTV